LLGVCFGLAAIAVVLAVSAGVARADVFAAVEVHPPGLRSDLDVEIVNASTGAVVPLPSGVNTAADELHPSITSDGSVLTFERKDNAAGTVRIIAVDLSTGQSADLFSAFEVLQTPPSDPSVLPTGGTDGSEVMTGRPMSAGAAGVSNPELTFTQVSFPSGSTAHGTLDVSGSVPASGRTDQTANPGPNGFLAQFAFDDGRPSGVMYLNGSVDLLSSASESYGHPAMQPGNTAPFVLFDARPVGITGALGPGDIEFRPGTPDGFLGTPSPLPAVVDSSLDESQPAVTADGRYVAFVRHANNGHDRLFLWDTDTQLLLNPAGVDLGAITSRDVGNVSLYTRNLVAGAHLRIDRAAVTLAQSAGVGILVQRIVGRRMVLDRHSFKLHTVGRIPLGRFKKGRHVIPWKLRINGRRLRPGRYLLTLRALSQSGVVRELATPKAFRVR
jgi:hypothetical protein